jgi:hypothetical protein
MRNQFCWKKSLSLGLVITLALLSGIQSWALCKEALGKLSSNKADIADAKQVIAKRIDSITSADSMAIFLEDIGEIGPVNHQTALSLAELFYRELGQEGCQNIARNLLMTHRHLAHDAVFFAFLIHAKGEDSGAQSLAKNFPKPINEKTFLRWTKLGTEMTANQKFMAKLDVAMGDFKAFEYVYGEHINRQQAFLDVVEGLNGLNNPSLVGQFIELFSKADRLTRQYILDKVSELKINENTNRMTVVLKGTQTKERNAQTQAIVAILSKSLNAIQELAYFDYTSNGISNRPVLPDAETTKTVALRFVKRKGYDLNDRDVNYTSEILVRHPTADLAVDDALIKLLESGTKMPDWKHQYSDISFALFELELLERNARGLSSFNLDLRYSTSVLSSKTDYKRYIKNVLELNANFGLQTFPALKQLALDYFHKYPEDLNNLHASQNVIVQKFKKDFGI